MDVLLVAFENKNVGEELSTHPTFQLAVIDLQLLLLWLLFLFFSFSVFLLVFLPVLVVLDDQLKSKVLQKGLGSISSGS
jgi:hypothetical protein